MRQRRFHRGGCVPAFTIILKNLGLKSYGKTKEQRQAICPSLRNLQVKSVEGSRSFASFVDECQSLLRSKTANTIRELRHHHLGFQFFCLPSCPAIYLSGFYLNQQRLRLTIK